jgi:hypothetical protein
MKNFLTEFPTLELLLNETRGLLLPEFRETNCHIHTHYSFSAFKSLETAFKLATEEKIAVLGINDFFATDGYDAFHKGCVKNRIFPLFNIEFVGLLRNEQKKGISINDPNNPGIVYFCGKGLDYPFTISWLHKRQLNIMKKESLAWIKAMQANLNQLSTGGAGFDEKGEKSFLELRKIIRIIIKAGGIPCYPVLLDDSSGRFTEFESDPEKLYQSLKHLGIECIELIPGRNDAGILKKFVDFFHQKGFIITFGTEHDTQEMIPLTAATRGSFPLDDSLKRIAYEGACVIAAHQYLRADGRQGYILPDGTHSVEQTSELINLGKLVIEYFLNKYEHET